MLVSREGLKIPDPDGVLLLNCLKGRLLAL